MTISRRNILKGLVGVTSVCCVPATTMANGISITRGCLIDSQSLQLKSRNGGSFGSITDKIFADDVIDSTGNRNLDRALGLAIVRIADLFDQRPGFGFYDDQNSWNAFASSENVIPGTWGTVLFGRNLFQDLLTRYNDEGMAILAIVAHEFAHIAQYKSGIISRLDRAHPTVKCVELHADYMAGYFLGVRKRFDENISVRHAGREIFRIGDSNFNDPQHHGTPEERIGAAEAGFVVGYETNTRFKQAFMRGVKHVLQECREPTRER